MVPAEGAAVDWARDTVASLAVVKNAMESRDLRIAALEAQLAEQREAREKSEAEANYLRDLIHSLPDLDPENPTFHEERIRAVVSKLRAAEAELVATNQRLIATQAELRLERGDEGNIVVENYVLALDAAEESLREANERCARLRAWGAKWLFNPNQLDKDWQRDEARRQFFDIYAALEAAEAAEGTDE